MPEYGLSLINVFPYKDSIYDQRKPIFRRILRSENVTLELGYIKSFQSKQCERPEASTKRVI